MVLYFQQKTDTISTKVSMASGIDSLPIWFWIAVVEFLVILFLIYKLVANKRQLPLNELTKDKLRKAKNEKVDMSNLMNSINNSRDLYKELSRSFHPDRFVNTDKQKIAEDLFQQITKNKRDFKKLNEIKKIAKDKLNIK